MADMPLPTNSHGIPSPVASSVESGSRGNGVADDAGTPAALGRPEGCASEDADAALLAGGAGSVVAPGAGLWPGGRMGAGGTGPDVGGVVGRSVGAAVGRGVGAGVGRGLRVGRGVGAGVGVGAGDAVAEGSVTVTVGPTSVGSRPWTASARKVTDHEPAGRLELPLNEPSSSDPETNARPTVVPATSAQTEVAATP